MSTRDEDGYLACLLGVNPQRYADHAPRLAAAGYRRWTNQNGRSVILKRHPIIPGEWTETPLE